MSDPTPKTSRRAKIRFRGTAYFPLEADEDKAGQRAQELADGLLKSVKKLPGDIQFPKIKVLGVESYNHDTKHWEAVPGAPEPENEDEE